MTRRNDDKRILQLFLSRDETALSLAAQSYGAYCFAVAFSILGSERDAEECVNDTWLRAWEDIPSSRPQKLRPYLAQITRRLALDRLDFLKAAKRGSGELELVLDELSDILPDSFETTSVAELKELAEAVDRFLYGLPKRDADIFIRRCFFMEPVKAVAKRYGLTPGYTATILNRTRTKLKKYLIKEEFLNE